MLQKQALSFSVICDNVISDRKSAMFISLFVTFLNKTDQDMFWFSFSLFESVLESFTWSSGLNEFTGITFTTEKMRYYSNFWCYIATEYITSGRICLAFLSYQPSIFCFVWTLLDTFITIHIPASKFPDLATCISNQSQWVVIIKTVLHISPITPSDN